MNIVFVCIAGWLAWQNKSYLKDHSMKMMVMDGGGKIKRLMVVIFTLIDVVGVILFSVNIMV